MINISSTQDAVIGEVEIAASPETVFAAITDPEQLKQWWGDGKNYRVERWEGAVRVGARYRSIGTGHTGEEVLVAAQGPGSEKVAGILSNTDLFRIMLSAYGWTDRH